MHTCIKREVLLAEAWFQSHMASSQALHVHLTALGALRTGTHVTMVQVALACEERGRLMEDVWQGFAGAMRGAVLRLADGHAEERRRYPRCALPALR
jgi:hypothetical protein